jgi:hypothetical protein
MSTILSNKRFQFHAESVKDGGTVKLSGEVAINEEGVIQSFNGQVSSAGNASGPGAFYGSFHHSLNGDRTSQGIDVPQEYRRETYKLLDDALTEITEQLASKKK